MTPSVYWDGYGLDAAASGVFVHASCLGAALAEQDFAPTLVLPAGAPGAPRFPGLPTVGLTGHLAHSSLARLKPLWPQLVSRRVRQLRGDNQAPYVLHGLSNFNLPWAGRDRRRRLVLTVHDLIPFLTPDGVSAALRLQLAQLLPRALARADQVVCVSQWTRDTLVERYPEVAGRCQVIANGLPPAASLDLARDRLGEALGKRPDRADGWLDVLYIARFEAYKQHALLLKIIATCPLPLRLTLVTGAAGEAFCRRAAPDLVLGGRLLFLAELTQAEVLQAHSRSDLYLSPSLYEGFCLPAAASLAAGKPVVYLAGSGIDEVVGAEVGVAVGRNASLDDWHQAVAAGLALGQSPGYAAALQVHLAQLTTWQQAATQLRSVYERLLQA